MMSINTLTKDKKDKHKNRSECAVLFGGAGYEHSVSVAGAGRFLSAAYSAGYSPLAVYIKRSGDFTLYTGSASALTLTYEPKEEELLLVSPYRDGGEHGFLLPYGRVPIKLAIPLLHGDFGEDGCAQGFLEMFGIPYVGADTVASALSADKAYAKLVAASVGVPTLPHLTFSRSDGEAYAASRIRDEIGFPAFIKPARLGSSVGASPAFCASDLMRSLSLAFSAADRIMAEPALTDKRELECAVLSIDGERIITAPGEAVCRGGFYSYESKYKDEKTKIYPIADVDSEVRDTLISYTERIFDALSLRHLARVDFFLSDGGKIYFNEINTMPGMTEGSLYPLMLQHAGVDFSALVSLLLARG